MDVHGVGMLNRCNQNFPYLKKGQMTGRPTRGLIQFLNQLAEAAKHDDRKC